MVRNRSELFQYSLSCDSLLDRLNRTGCLELAHHELILTLRAPYRTLRVVEARRIAEPIWTLPSQRLGNATGRLVAANQAPKSRPKTAGGSCGGPPGRT